MPITVGRNQPNSYRIESITISNNEGNSYEVSNMMVEFNISESIYQMFLTGSITLADSANFFNRIGFTGQEYIRNTWSICWSAGTISSPLCIPPICIRIYS